MYTLLVTISVIMAIILIIVVLLQAAKGEGLSGSIGGGVGNFGTMFGARRTADFLTKATWWLGGGLLVMAIVINLFFLPGQTTKEQRESIIQKSRELNSVPTQPTLPPAEVPPVENNQQENSNK